MTTETLNLARKLYEDLKVAMKDIYITSIDNDWRDCQQLVLYKALEDILD